MKRSIAALVLIAPQSCSGYTVTQPLRVAVQTTAWKSSALSMNFDGKSDRSHTRFRLISYAHQQKSLDISKTTHTVVVTSPKDAYLSFAEKGMSTISDGSGLSERKSLNGSKLTQTAFAKSPKDDYLAFTENGMSNAKMAVLSSSGYSIVQPLQVAVPTTARKSYPTSMVSDGSDRSERKSLDISKTTYTAMVKSPKDAYLAFAEKGMSNAKMHWLKILHQSILGGAYVGFAGLLALSVAGNISGIGFSNPGLVKMTFAALFPVNLLMILMTGGQLFTGNTATVAGAKFEKMVYWREVWKSFAVSIIGNIIGCGLFALTADYIGLLKGGTGALACSTAVAKCAGTFGQTMTKAILCNWMVSIAVFMAGASNDLSGKLVGCWFPISTFVAIGLEHSVANFFIMPCALLLGAKITISDVIFKNLIPVIIGNAIAGSLVVAGSYSFQYGLLGKKSQDKFQQKLQKYEIRKRSENKEFVCFE